MPNLPDILLFRDVSKLQELAEGLFISLKYARSDGDKRIALANGLDSLLERSSKLEHLSGLHTQLVEVQAWIRAADPLRSRYKVPQFQNIQGLWYELLVRIKQVIEVNKLEMLAQMFKARVKQERPYKGISRYQITNQVEISKKVEIFKQGDQEVATTSPASPFTSVESNLGTGQIGNLSVTYRYVISDRTGTVNKLVKESIDYISQSPSWYANLAQLVGVTEGHNGINGIVFVMDGIALSEFALGQHSGAVWARCIRGFEAFFASNLELKSAERITVTPHGRVTVLPPMSLTTTGLRNRVDIVEVQRYQRNEAVQLMIEIYAKNRAVLGLENLGTFVASLAEFERALTRIQVTMTAARCSLFPFNRFHYFGHGFGPMPSFQPQIGEFGLASYRHGELVDWESLGISRYVQNIHISNQPSSFVPLDWCKSQEPNGDQWLTYILRDPSPYDNREMLDTDFWICEKQLRKPYPFLWESIFTEAGEISRRLNIDLDRISFCHRTNSTTELTRLQDGDWNELPTTLYYHWSPHSSNPYKAQGFLSTDRTPNLSALQDQYMQKCWNMKFRLSFGTYEMSDDWGRQYEREVKQGMETMPGSYPGIKIGEFS